MPLNRRHLLLSASGAFLPGLAVAEGLAPLRVVSADLPPFAVERSAERAGVLVELVEELLRRTGQPTRVEFYPWARAMKMAVAQPRIAILPLLRTPEREAQYQWLLKLYVLHFVFISRAGQPPVQSLEQARRLRVAVLRSTPQAIQLLKRGFSDKLLLQANSVEDTLRLLERGHADAIYGGELIHLDKVRSSGRDLGQFQFGLRLDSGDIWLAASSGFGAAERALLFGTHQAMLRDGSVERLFKAYGLKPRAEDLQP
jgi:polar amino acid transport system substrate-binding protein